LWNNECDLIDCIRKVGEGSEGDLGANTDWPSCLLVAANSADFPGKARVSYRVDDPSKTFQELNELWRLIAQLLLGKL
jgi:hypothetical protein